jgi:predicted RNase H-like HicB family nuclease
MSINVTPRAVVAEYTAVIKQDASWWIGWIEEVPGVNCQVRSRDGLLDSLDVALREALQMNRRDARAAAGEDFAEVKIAV